MDRLCRCRLVHGLAIGRSGLKVVFGKFQISSRGRDRGKLWVAQLWAGQFTFYFVFIAILTKFDWFISMQTHKMQNELIHIEILDEMAKSNSFKYWPITSNCSSVYDLWTDWKLNSWTDSQLLRVGFSKSIKSHTVQFKCLNKPKCSQDLHCKTIII